MMYPVLPQSFFVGECFDAYRLLGAHPAQGPHGEAGWQFNVWAPGATAVEICGGFDGWGPGVPMEKANTGLWSGFIAGLAEGDLYKYRVHGADGSVVLRADPYAFSTELRPGKIKKLRIEMDFTQAQITEALDVTPRCISNVKNSRTAMSLRILIYYAQLMEISLDSLVSRIDSNYQTTALDNEICDNIRQLSADNKEKLLQTLKIWNKEIKL